MSAAKVSIRQIEFERARLYSERMSNSKPKPLSLRSTQDQLNLWESKRQQVEHEQTFDPAALKRTIYVGDAVRVSRSEFKDLRSSQYPSLMRLFLLRIDYSVNLSDSQIWSRNLGCYGELDSPLFELR